MVVVFFCVQKYCMDDEYTWGGVVYSLDYRPIDGDVSREQNALATANFKPHGEKSLSSVPLLSCAKASRTEGKALYKSCVGITMIVEFSGFFFLICVLLD